ncbi:MAG: histidine phosphatase family protein [Bacilli bacterium]|nr:histidine phosphatase family protein [Bacilli bacterium]
MIEITYFVHGTTYDNEAKRASGWLPGELSEKGITQAIALAKTIKDEYFDIVISSDLNRAIQSSKLDFYNRDIKMIRDSRIRECNYGLLDGKDASLVIYGDHIEEKFPNGESLKDVESRIRDFIGYLKENFDGKKVAIVAHRAPQLALDVILKSMSWEEAIANDWRNTKNWQPGWKYIIE